LGLEDSLLRRYALIEDITVNNVIWANADAKKSTGRLAVFAELRDEVTVRPTDIKNAQSMNIVDFINASSSIRSIDALFESRISSNLVSLITSANLNTKSLFKWQNGERHFSWAYYGNITDSLIKERVKAAGGKVEGDLCCRLSWNNSDDLDFHLVEKANSYEIYYGNRGRRSPNGGILDVDANGMDGIRSDPCENIYYASKHTMRPGAYYLFVHQYSKRNSTDYGFEGEIDSKLFGGRDYVRLICDQSKATHSNVGFIYRELGKDMFYQITDKGRAFLTEGGYTALREAGKITDRPPKDI